MNETRSTAVAELLPSTRKCVYVWHLTLSTTSYQIVLFRDKIPRISLPKLAFLTEGKVIRITMFHQATCKSWFQRHIMIKRFLHIFLSRLAKLCPNNFFKPALLQLKALCCSYCYVPWLKQEKLSSSQKLLVIYNC
jgi:hypothetical protein